MMTQEKRKTPKWVWVTAGVFLIGATGAITIMSIRPSQQSQAPSISPVESAEAQWSRDRAAYLQLLMSIDVDPKTPQNGGVIQSLAMQRALEIMDHANAERSRIDSPNYRLPFEVVIYRLQQANNEKIVNAHRGRVDFVKTFTLPTGEKVEVKPTSTSVLGETLLDELAFNFVVAQISRKVKEEDVRAMLNSQKTVSDSLALLLEQKQQGDVLKALDEVKKDELVNGGGTQK